MEIKIEIALGLTPALEGILRGIFGREKTEGRMMRAEVVEAHGGAGGATPEAEVPSPSTDLLTPVLRPEAGALQEEAQTAPPVLHPEAGSLQGAAQTPTPVLRPEAGALQEEAQTAPPSLHPEAGALQGEAQTAAGEAQTASQERGTVTVSSENPRFTDEDLRTFMDRTISKFCGSDWEENRTPQTAACRRSLTAIFKGIAQHLGAPKPTALPDDKRGAFVAALEGIVFNTNKGICEWDPF